MSSPSTVTTVIFTAFRPSSSIHQQMTTQRPNTQKVVVERLMTMVKTGETAREIAGVAGERWKRCSVKSR